VPAKLEEGEVVRGRYGVTQDEYGEWFLLLMREIDVEMRARSKSGSRLSGVSCQHKAFRRRSIALRMCCQSGVVSGRATGRMMVGGSVVVTRVEERENERTLKPALR
jgi:hypothetical protein